MNFILGGSIIAAILKTQYTFGFDKNNRNNAFSERLYRDIIKRLPTFLSLTITFGVAPLLFLQSLYGPLFYTSTILMAPFWLMILAAVMVSYYIMYILSWSPANLLKPVKLPLLLIAIGGFLYTAFMFSSNNSLMQAPQKFYSIYHSTIYGIYVYITDLTLFLRFFHMLFGALIVTSVILFLISYLEIKSDPQYSNYIAGYSKKIFLISFLIQAALGFGMFFTQKSELMKLLSGGSPAYSIIFWTGVVMAFAAAVLAHLKLESAASQSVLLSVSGISLICMAVTRDFIRDFEIGKAFSYAGNPYEWNYIVVSAFVLTLLGGIGVIFYMLGLAEKDKTI